MLTVDTSLLTKLNKFVSKSSLLYEKYTYECSSIVGNSIMRNVHDPFRNIIQQEPPFTVISKPHCSRKVRISQLSVTNGGD